MSTGANSDRGMDVYIGGFGKLGNVSWSSSVDTSGGISGDVFRDIGGSSSAEGAGYVLTNSVAGMPSMLAMSTVSGTRMGEGGCVVALLSFTASNLREYVSPLPMSAFTTIFVTDVLFVAGFTAIGT